jgi:hypothetical protein
MSQEGWSFREELFSPAEAATCTGLSLPMQRDWRRAAHLKQRPGVTYFTPREMAEVRIMLKLRQLGMRPSMSRPVAETVAPSVLFQAVMLGGVIASLDRDIKKVINDADLITIAKTISGVDIIFRYGVAVNDSFALVEDTRYIKFRSEDEVTAVVNFYTMAQILTRKAGRPLFTIIGLTA